MLLKYNNNFFLLGYFLWITISMLDITNIKNGNWDFIYILSGLCFIANELFLNKYTKQTIIYACFVALVIIFSMLQGTGSVLYILVILFSSRYTEIEKIAKVTFYTLVIVFLLTIFLANISVIESEISFRGTERRNSLGFVGRTYASYFILGITAWFCCLKKEKHFHIFLFCILLGNLYVYQQTRTRNGFILTCFLILVLFAFNKRRKVYKSEKLITVAIFPISFISIFVTSYFFNHNSSFFVTLDKILSYRLSYAHQALLDQKISLFGTQIPWNQLSYIVDSSYLRILFDSGLVGFLVMFTLLEVSAILAVKNSNIIMMYLCITYAAHYMFDPTITAVFFNPLVFVAVSYAYQNGKQRN